MEHEEGSSAAAEEVAATPPPPELVQLPGANKNAAIVELNDWFNRRVKGAAIGKDTRAYNTVYNAVELAKSAIRASKE